MENVLDIYTAKPDPARPLVCFDEFSKQLLSEIAPPIAPHPGTKDSPGQPIRSDAEYVREGSASAFMIAMPHLGRREVFVGKDARRTALDYADAVAFLCDEIFPDAEKITVVQDNLNTHGPGVPQHRCSERRKKKQDPPSDQLAVHLQRRSN